MYKDFGVVVVTGQVAQVGGLQRGSIMQKSIANMKMCSKFSATKSQQVQNKFVVEHFAGPVCYLADSFIEKNMDELPADAGDLIRNSVNEIILESKVRATKAATRCAVFDTCVYVLSLPAFFVDRCFGSR